MYLHVQLLKIILLLWLLLPSCNSHPCTVLLHQLFPLCIDKSHGWKAWFSSSETSSGVSLAWALFKEQCSYVHYTLDCQYAANGLFLISTLHLKWSLWLKWYHLVEGTCQCKHQHSTFSKKPIWSQFSIFYKLICLKNKLPFKNYGVGGKLQY